MLRVHTKKLGGVITLHLQGQIVNGVESVRLRNAVFAQEGASAVVLDLAHVDLIDAGGLGLLLDLREWTRSRGIEFRLMNVTRRVQHVLEITCLDSVFEISSEGIAQSAAAHRCAEAVVATAACA